MTRAESSTSLQSAGPPVQLRVTWDAAEQLPLAYANQLAATSDGIDVMFTFGQVAPPVIQATTPEAFHDALAALPPLPVQPVARLVMSRQKAAELLQLLEQLQL